MQHLVLKILVPDVILKLNIFVCLGLGEFFKGLVFGLEIEEFLFVLLEGDGGLVGLVDVGGLLVEFGFGKR